MIAWKNITLFKYQQMEQINGRPDMEAIDKSLFCVCAVYGLTEYQLDRLGAAKAFKMVQKVERLFSKECPVSRSSRIGRYSVNYDPSTMTFGQYVELMFFLQQPLAHAHYVMASIAVDQSADHPLRANYFLQQPITKILGSLKFFIERFAAFNGEYKALFGLDEDVVGVSAFVHQFNKRYGWTYSATKVAEHERITLEEAFRLPVRQALNALIFLKAKASYEAEMVRQSHKSQPNAR